ncbi:MAG: 2-phospho-L-lactate transferase CofD family protein, partial [Myxococcaceae bacterium]
MTLPAPAPVEPLPVIRVVPRPRARPARPLRIVALGGGTGLPVVLRGLARHVRPRKGRPGVELTAVVAMSDD